MHVSASKVLLYNMILYDGNCILMYLVDLFLMIFVSCMNKNCR